MVEMTKTAVAQICKDLKLYRTPELNDKLYLHYKGFRRIENLEEYTGVRALWLEGNGLQEIEGLENCVELRSLYIQENCIAKIEKLDKCVQLATLNLNKNCVEKIENLGNLPKLETLMLSHNRLETKEDLEQVVECQAVTTLDVQHNRIDDVGVLDVLVQMKNLRAVYLQGNPVVKKIKYYRKKMTVLLPDLRYLDDRPVFPDDRLRAEAFMRALDADGGNVKAAQEAERTEIKRQRAEKKAKEEANFQAFEDLIRNARLQHEVEQRQKLLDEQEKTEQDDDDDADSPWAVGGETKQPVGSAGSDGKNTGQRTVEAGHAKGINPFFNEAIVETTENPNLTAAREARLAGIMSRGATAAAPAAPQAAVAAAPPLPPSASAVGDDDDDDIFGWEPSSALMQLQGMVGEVDREESEKSGAIGTERKSGIVIAADVERKAMSVLKKQVKSMNISGVTPVNSSVQSKLKAAAVQAAAEEVAAEQELSIPPPVEETDVEELD
jgi:dynein assembly factor 1, axonemal